jgi:Holliday junction resolvasome RuvABC DNA-binding subunit
VEWLKVKALSSSPSTTKKKKKEARLNKLHALRNLSYQQKHAQTAKKRMENNIMSKWNLKVNKYSYTHVQQNRF